MLLEQPKGGEMTLGAMQLAQHFLLLLTGKKTLLDSVMFV